ncbi:MAG: hypothetical protein QOI74_1877 [Micromonosporaceae bacterium]|nr:hypothetical protein [Micromonosporaceae bacterium]MDT5035365.1 hypothetical protein [Micromonosporaceae bacterium]
MFEEIAGIPAHPLLVHAAVVFVPLLAGGALLYAFFPRLRYRLRWPVGVVALAAAVAAVSAHQSGNAFRSRLIAKSLTSQAVLTKLVQHKQFGDAAMWATLGLAVATLVFLIAVPGRPPGFEGPPTGGWILQMVFAGVLAILAAASVYYIVRTGDTGAHIVWKGF